jgi:c-di-GMP-binding flagellar brake protein YcgR
MEMLLACDRGSSRRAVRVHCQVVREHDFKLLGETAVDLSTEGMLLLSEAPVRTGEEVVVTFRVPGTDRWIDACATVARVVHGRRHGDPGRAIGLRFDGLDSADKRTLRWALRRIPPTFPSRSVRIDYAATASLIALS